MTTNPDRFLATVECRAGYRDEQVPHSLTVWNKRFDVSEILDSWLSPGQRYFKLLTTDGVLFILRRNVEIEEWEVIVYDRRPSERYVR